MTTHVKPITHANHTIYINSAGEELKKGTLLCIEDIDEDTIFVKPVKIVYVNSDTYTFTTDSGDKT